MQWLGLEPNQSCIAQTALQHPAGQLCVLDAISAAKRPGDDFHAVGIDFDGGKDTRVGHLVRVKHM
jgi:hypothetical protein